MPYTDLFSDRSVTDRIRIAIAIPLLLLIIPLNSCSKKEAKVGNPATLQVFNTLDDGTNLYINLSGNRPAPFSTSRRIFNKHFALNNNVFYVDASPQPIAFYNTLDTLPKDGPVLSADLNLEQGGIYSLFLYGDKSAAAYHVEKDLIPALRGNDSVMAIRFANFSDQQTISINLKDHATGSFVQQLPQGSLSGFIELKADLSVAAYEFEIRDQVTGDLITTYLADGINGFPLGYPWLNKSHTLVLVGKQGSTGTSELKIVRMNHR